MLSKDERLQYQRQLYPYLATSIAVFSAGALLGVLLTFYAPHVSRYFNENLSGFVKLFRALPKFQLAAAIFLNNAIKAFLVVVGGLVFGLFPVIFLLANGAALGFVLSVSVQSRGALAALLAILPHGIFELPAIFLATSMGLLLGSRAIRKLSGSGETTIRGELTAALKFFMRIIVPLLVIAALVESFLTSVLVTT
jgi:stage II sporulation protein M